MVSTFGTQCSYYMLQSTIREVIVRGYKAVLLLITLKGNSIDSRFIFLMKNKMNLKYKYNDNDKTKQNSNNNKNRNEMNI